MSDIEQARQRDEIKDIWDAIEGMREDDQKQWGMLREMRVILIGVDGINGMNSRVKAIEIMVRGLEGALEVLRRYVDTQIANHPLTCQVGRMVEQHIQDGKEIYVTKRADWQKWVQTIAMLIGGMSMLATWILLVARFL